MTAFRGWPAEAIEFYEGLEADNSKTYWTAHLGAYEQHVRGPLLALLAELEAEFGAGRIFRPYRDVRFSADKSPYKTNIGAVLETGGYVTLSARGLGVGNGMYMMERDELLRYRAAIHADVSGEALREVIAAIESGGAVVQGSGALRTVPRGFARDHVRADLLRYRGIYAWREWEPGAWLGRAAAKKRVVEVLRSSAPLQEWLRTHVAP
jgi:uncharacterized protein (TIGR02453 family)